MILQNNIFRPGGRTGQQLETSLCSVALKVSTSEVGAIIVIHLILLGAAVNRERGPQLRAIWKYLEIDTTDGSHVVQLINALIWLSSGRLLFLAA